jgi:hypothetical protein
MRGLEQQGGFARVHGGVVEVKLCHAQPCAPTAELAQERQARARHGDVREWSLCPWQPQRNAENRWRLLHRRTRDMSSVCLETHELGSGTPMQLRYDGFKGKEAGAFPMSGVE